MSSKVQIVGVSDVSMGYGSPQLPFFLRHLRKYGNTTTPLLIEPDQNEKPARHENLLDLQMRRIPTIAKQYTDEGLLEYLDRAADLINATSPRYLVLSAPSLLPLLGKLKKRPFKTIYYMLESLSYYQQQGGRRAKAILGSHRLFNSLIDLVIFPEENRAEEDVKLAGMANIPYFLFYNTTASADRPEALEWNARNGRILYSGTVERGLTFAEYFTSSKIQRYPIDIFGLVEGPTKQQTFQELQSLKKNVRYHGYIDARTLDEIRPRYAFSFVSWNPLNSHLLNACPNKFFEAIADGVVPITAPHPQCMKVIAEYDCGIVLDDWSFDSFQSGLRYALDIYATPRYQQLVGNCFRARREKLNFSAQFKQIEPLL